jgi:hypothetical protein
VYYRGLPKKFIAGTVYTPADEEIVEGATVTAKSSLGTFSTTTDDWGDFWLNNLPDAEWELSITKGDLTKTMAVSTVEEDRGLGDIALS